MFRKCSTRHGVSFVIFSVGPGAPCKSLAFVSGTTGMLAKYKGLWMSSRMRTCCMTLFTVESLPSDSSFESFDAFVRRLSSRDQHFLPCRQMLSLRTSFLPPIDLLLDGMVADDHHPSETTNTVRPLCKLILELISVRTVIPRDDILRILYLRAAGKTISITHLGPSRSFDVVEDRMSTYDLGEELI